MAVRYRQIAQVAVFAVAVKQARENPQHFEPALRRKKIEIAPRRRVIARQIDARAPRPPPIAAQMTVLKICAPFDVSVAQQRRRVVKRRAGDGVLKIQNPRRRARAQKHQVARMIIAVREDPRQGARGGANLRSRRRESRALVRGQRLSQPPRAIPFGEKIRFGAQRRLVVGGQPGGGGAQLHLRERVDGGAIQRFGVFAARDGARVIVVAQIGFEQKAALVIDGQNRRGGQFGRGDSPSRIDKSAQIFARGRGGHCDPRFAVRARAPISAETRVAGERRDAGAGESRRRADKSEQTARRYNRALLRLMFCARARLHSATVIFAYLALAGAGFGAGPGAGAQDAPPIVIEGESLRAEDGIVRAVGDARAQAPQGEMRADFIEFDRNRNRLRAEGGVSVRAEGLRARADFIEYRDRDAEMRNFDIHQSEGNLRVRGARATIADGNLLRAYDAAATTCPAVDEDWKIAADEIVADWRDNQARAYGARFYLSGLPIFYLPYTQFVVDSRRKRSGVLPPIIGSRDGDFDFALPIYWFLAEDTDATITPRWISERGLLLENELRWLRPQASGELRVDGFVGEDQRRGAARGRWDFDHEQRRGAWTARARAIGVSDGEYYDDISRDGDDSTRRNLPHSIELEYRPDDEWLFGAEAARYRTIGEVDREPADILPRLYAVHSRVFTAGRADARGEYARFAADDARASIELESIDYDRFVWDGEIEVDRRLGSWRWTPAVGIKVARHLARNAPTAAPSPGSGYATPHASLEAERLWRGGVSSGGGYAVGHRLRLFYAFAPHSEQDDLPLLDTTERGGAAALFDWNRFAGDDRAADANFLSFGFGGDFSRRARAVEPPLFSSWSYFLAQRYHFRAPRTTLPDEIPPQAGLSGMHLSARARNDATSIRAELEWDAKFSKLDRANMRFDRSVSPALTVRAAYRQYEGEEGETERIADAAFDWRFGRQQWSIETAYSLTDESLRGGHLRATLPDDCGCWNLQFEVERVFESESESRTSWSLRFYLDGF